MNGSVYCIGVLAPKYPMTNFIYMNLAAYTGCTGGAWLSNVSMPIILGANGVVQVMNNNYEIYSTSKNN